MAETPRPGPSAAAFIPEVKHTVAVSSGKGGVGKSTVASSRRDMPWVSSMSTSMDPMYR